VRFFLIDHTALELFAKLPLYSAIPVDGPNPTVPFKRTYALEGGLRFAGRMPDAEDRPRLLTRWSDATRR